METKYIAELNGEEGKIETFTAVYIDLRNVERWLKSVPEDVVRRDIFIVDLSGNNHIFNIDEFNKLIGG